MDCWMEGLRWIAGWKDQDGVLDGRIRMECWMEGLKWIAGWKD